MANVDLVMRLLAEDRASDKFKKVGAEARSAERNLDKFKTAAKAISAASIVAFGVSSVKAYSDAEKEQAKLEGAYKRFAGNMNVPIESLRGLNSELQKTTTFDDDVVAGAQAVLAQFKLTGTQIQQLTPLLLDYAAATGKDASTAAGDLGKAMLGQGRALKAVGIDFKATGDSAQDFTRLTGALRTQVGGFAEREGKTAAGQLAILQNQFGDLQESVGEALVPALEGLVDVATPVLDTFNQLPKPIKTATVGVVALSGAALVLTPRIMAAKAALSGMGGASSGLGGKLKGMGAMLAGPWGIALAGATVGIGAYMDAQANAKEAVDALTESLDKQTGASTSQTLEKIANALASDISLDDWKKLPFTLSEVTSAVANGGSELETFRGKLDAFIDSNSLGTDSMMESARVAKLLGSSVQNQNEVVYDARKAWEAHKAAQDAAKTAVTGLSGKVDDQTSAVGALQTAWKRLQGTLSQQDAADAQTRSVSALTESLKKNGKGFAGNSEAALDNRDALRQAMSALKDQIDSYTTAESKAKAYKSGVSELKAALKKQGLTDKEIARLLKPLTDMQQEVDDLKGKIPSSPIPLRIKPQITGDGKIIIAAPGGGRQLLDVDYRADGGPVRKGHDYIVGERGVELFRPTQNGVIVPNHALAAGAGHQRTPGVVAVNLYLDGKHIQTSLIDLERRQSGLKIGRRGAWRKG